MSIRVRLLRLVQCTLVAVLVTSPAAAQTPPPASTGAGTNASAQQTVAQQSAQHTSPPPTTGTRVIILGTGTPNADPDRSGPSVAIVVGDRSYIVDAGPGVVRRAAAAAKKDDAPALLPPGLRTVFLTHLHSDHTAGLPDLMLTPWVLDRTEPLNVYGPEGTASMIEHLTMAYDADTQLRLHGGEPSNKTGYRTIAHEIHAGEIYRDSLITVTAIEVQHGQWPHAYAYRFQTKDRVIVISGDTRPSPAVIAACNGCDVLVHEVYSAEKFKARTADWQSYHSAYHTSTLELAELASKAHPKLLVLYHQLYWGDNDDALVAQVRSVYSGAIRSAADLDVF